MKLRILKGPETNRVVEPDPMGYAIGRGKDNDLVLHDEGISRHHCRIVKTAAGWAVEDLGSVNGIRLNGRRVDGSEPLGAGDIIAICEQELRVEFDDQPLAVSALPRPAAEPLAPPPVPAGHEPPPVAYALPGATPEEEAAGGGWRALPWGRIALLVAMFLLIGVLVHLLFSGPETKTPANPAETPAVATASGEAESAGPALSDSELDDLLTKEAALVATNPAAAPTAPTTPTDEEDTAEAPAAAPATPADTAPVPVAPAPGDAAASEMVLVRSTPEGATVLIDEEEKGVTPLLVSGLSMGRHRITLQMAGYQDQQRLIHVPDVIASTPYVLRQRPNTLYVTSDPPGVSVWRGSQWLGTAPILLQDLPAGEITLTLAMAGCPPRREKATISGVRGEQLNVSMKPELGNVEVETVPPGCQVLIDGQPMGITVSEQTGPGSVGRLSVPNLLVGERTLQVEHPCGANLTRKLVVAVGETLKQNLRLWVPDTQLTLVDGETKAGMLMERNEQGDVVLAQSPLAKDMNRYLKPRVRAERPLDGDEAREVFERVVAPEATKEKEGAEPGKEGEAPAAGWGDEAEGTKPAAGGEGEKPAAKEKDRVAEITADELTKRIETVSKTVFLQHYNGTTLQVTGLPSSLRRDGLDGVVMFGRRIRCEFDREVFGTERDKLNALVETGKTPLTIKGKVQGFVGDRLVLRECRPVFGTPAAPAKP